MTQVEKAEPLCMEGRETNQEFYMEVRVAPVVVEANS